MAATFYFVTRFFAARESCLDYRRFLFFFNFSRFLMILPRWRVPIFFTTFFVFDPTDCPLFIDPQLFLIPVSLEQS